MSLSSGWDRLQELFHSACELDPSLRTEFLERECGDDLALLEEARMLVEAESDTMGMQLAVSRTAAELSGPQPGSRIGPYEVIRTIGEGGMGAVYLAVRADDHFRKQVAIKLLHTGFPTPRMLARFRRERQILADLDHPYIARILDGGATDAGAPYLVMEFVDGVPLTAYQRQRPLPIDEKLRIFRQICQAVSYAHRKLIVHRDIKPGNILLTSDGTPKLVDFGIAKLLTPETDGPRAGTTEYLMTPEYASPEQVRNESITTATDVYALGVVLYEWLTGRRPYEVRNLNPGELERAICITDPVKPSAIADQSPAVSRELRGDLDTIVLTAMQKDLARRYATVDRLEEDIRRYLDGLPVSARPDTWWYRAQKFTRRHTLAVGAAAALLTILVGFSTGMAVLAKRLAKERDVATRQAARAEQISQFLTNLFKVSDPSEARGNTITAREILDSGAARISKDLKHQPAVEAALLDTIGNVYEDLGLYPRAQSLFEQSLSLRSAEHSGSNTDIAQSYFNVAKELDIRGKDYAQAEAYAQKALVIRRKRFGPRSVQVADCLELLGNLARSEGDSKQAQAELKQAYDLKRDLLGEQNVQTAQAAYDLGRAIWMHGDSKPAEALFAESLRTREKLLPPDDPKTLDSMEAIALMLEDDNRLPEAERYFRRVLAGRRRFYGENHYGTAIALDNLASVLQEEHNFGEAEMCYRQSIAIERKTIGERSGNTAVTINNLASLLRDEGQRAAAEALYREAVDIDRHALGGDHPMTALMMRNLADILLAEHKLSEAGLVASQALAIERKRLDAKDPALARTLRTVAGVEEARNQDASAAADYANALTIARAASSEGLQASIALRYGALLMKMNEDASAESQLQNAFAIQTKLHGPQSDEAVDAEEQLGICLGHLKQQPEARDHLEHAYQVMRRTRGERDQRTLKASSQLASSARPPSRP